ncbi:WXG100 family type VII secretion target [Bacillus pseudomycoides]|uniref:WXG100 family type VII secretion target n=1 Tax=Bacillus pseudomycoides TaxID=64104 RepID=UPI001FB394CC|nr:WXG100 family type VII secretion target [Bacillus pseudomycoides]
MEIKVKPEQLEQLAKNISEMQRHSQNVQQNLNQAMFSIQMQWQGATSQHFYGEYMKSTKLMERYIHNLQETEKDLRRIAQKFRQADEEYQKKQAEKVKETPKKEKKEEKSWWEKGLDEAAEFFGVNDAIRAVTGKDPRTGKELSTKERLIAAGWTLLNIIPVGKVLSTAGKVIKYGGKILLDGVKKVSSKLHEGVSFLASKAKGLSNKIGDLWNKGKTKVKNDFIEADKAFRYAMKKLGEYVPKFGRGPSPVMEGVGAVSGGGKQSLKDDVIQFMKETGEKIFGSGLKGWNLKPSNIPNMPRQELLDSVPNNWKINDNNGFAHIRDENGLMRMRIDPPDKVTKYDHVHIYDEAGNSLDVNGNIVDSKSPAAHIPYKK